MLLVEGGEVHENVDPLALRRDHLELLLEGAHEIGPLFELLIDARQAPQGMQMPRLDVDHLAIDLGRASGVTEARFVELRDTQLRRGHLVRLPQSEHLPLQDIREIAILGA
jgi:hypothetical protein